MPLPPAPTHCETCGKPLPVQVGPGRKRKRHEGCPMPGSIRLPRKQDSGSRRSFTVEAPAAHTESAEPPAPEPAPEPPPREELPLDTGYDPDDTPLFLDDGVGILETATRERLRTRSQHQTPEGLAVLALARRIDRSTLRDTGSAYASLVKEFRAQLAGMTPPVAKPAVPAAPVAAPEPPPPPAPVQESDPMDDVARKRRQKELGA